MIKEIAELNHAFKDSFTNGLFFVGFGFNNYQYHGIEENVLKVVYNNQFLDQLYEIELPISEDFLIANNDKFIFNMYISKLIELHFIEKALEVK